MTSSPRRTGLKRRTESARRLDIIRARSARTAPPVMLPHHLSCCAQSQHPAQRPPRSCECGNRPLRLPFHTFTSSFRTFTPCHSARLPPVIPHVYPRHSARSRGIQKTRAWIVLPELLDAATTRSMTGGSAQRGGGGMRRGGAECSVAGAECGVAGRSAAWRGGVPASTTPGRGIDADTEIVPQGFDALAYRVVHANGRPPFSIRLAAPFVRRVEAELGA